MRFSWCPTDAVTPSTVSYSSARGALGSFWILSTLPSLQNSGTSGNCLHQARKEPVVFWQVWGLKQILSFWWANSWFIAFYSTIKCFWSFFSPSVSTVGSLNRQCLSCNFLKEQCTYFSAKFSPMNRHFLLHCKGKSNSRGVMLFASELMYSLEKGIRLESNTYLSSGLLKVLYRAKTASEDVLWNS